MNSQNNRPSSLFQQGLDLMNSNKLQEAKELFTQICAANPSDAEVWHQLSTINGRLGAISEANECCRRALDIQPEHYEARVNLGNVLYSQGKFEEAATQYQKAIQINPNNPGARSNLGNLLGEMGKYDEAAASYQAAIQLDPDFTIAYQNLGNLRLTQGIYDKAANNYIRAIQLNPNDPSLHNSLGITLMNLGRKDDALTSFRHAAQLKPDYVDVYNNIGNFYLGQANYHEALEQYQLALHFAPSSPEVLNNIGTVYFDQGELDKAISYYQRALEIDPLYIVALNNLGKVCRFKGYFDLYIKYYHNAVERLSDATAARIAFIENIQNIVPAGYNPWLDDELKKCYMLSGANYDAMTICATHHLKHKYEIQASDEYDNDYVLAIIKKIAADDLFLLFLEKTFIADADLELLLTRVRRTLLFKHCQENSIGPTELKLVSALALQGLSNEYVYVSDDTEDRQLSDLKHSIENLVPTLKSPTEEIERKLFIYGMYDRLYSLSCREQLRDMPPGAWSAAIRPLLEQTLSIPFEEARIKQDIVTISRIEDQTSQLVQSQYEENPYPRWLSIPKLKLGNIKYHLKRQFPHFTPPAFLDGPIQILIAGCGTGRQPIQTAMYYDNVEVLAVDISKSSLAYAIRMAQKYDVKNIKFLQGDILELAKLEKQFHIIECIGVLHHMKDPVAGWKVLTGLLVKNGLMSIGLYSELARKPIVAAREIIKNENLASDSKNIRNLRMRILKHELGDVLYKNANSSDFYSTSGCRDLLFHFMEHRFTLPQIDKILHDLALEFIGFEFFSFESANNNAKNLYRNQFPQDPEMTNLALWDQFETMRPQTFRKMYDLWCQKKD